VSQGATSTRTPAPTIPVGTRPPGQPTPTPAPPPDPLLCDLVPAACDLPLPLTDSLGGMPTNGAP
jgi:hypothetical protein